MNRPTARRIGQTGKFLRQLRRMDGEMKKRARGAMRYLQESKDPISCGRFKGREDVPGRGANMPIYAYAISRSYRLICAIHADTVVFARVGDHKAVYGRD